MHMEFCIKKFLLILFFIYSTFFFIGSMLAPIFAHFQLYDFSAILTSTYMYSCHQQPDRSFWILGYPVALCARCTGFYLGVMLTSIFTLFKHFKIKFFLLTSIIIFILTDIILNFIFKFNTGNILRFIAGFGMGYLFIQVLCFAIEYIIKLIKRRTSYES